MPHLPIDPHREYKPMEIYKNGFILNTKGKPDYKYILRLITLKKLKAKNYCQGKVGKIFKVLGQDIINWKKGTSFYEPPAVPKDYPYTFRNKPFPQPE